MGDFRLVRCTSRGWTGARVGRKSHWGIRSEDVFIPELCLRVGKTPEKVLRAEIESRREAIRNQRRALRQLQRLLDGRTHDEFPGGGG